MVMAMLSSAVRNHMIKIQKGHVINVCNGIFSSAEISKPRNVILLRENLKFCSTFLVFYVY